MLPEIDHLTVEELALSWEIIFRSTKIGKFFNFSLSFPIISLFSLFEEGEELGAEGGVGEDAAHGAGGGVVVAFLARVFIDALELYAAEAYGAEGGEEREGREFPAGHGAEVEGRCEGEGVDHAHGEEGHIVAGGLLHGVAQSARGAGRVGAPGLEHSAAQVGEESGEHAHIVNAYQQGQQREGAQCGG